MNMWIFGRGGEFMYKKLLLLVLTTGLLYILSVGVFAAPQTINSSYRGNSGIIYVTNPNDGITTFKNHTVVSVIGDEGVIVTLYVYDANAGEFVLYTERNGENSWFVGPSGLFIKRLPIGNGVNYIGVFGESNGVSQFISRRVDRGSKAISEGIKSILIKSIKDVVQ